MGRDTDEVLGPDWWRTESILVAQLRDLVTGLDEIGSFTIPFARLPRRFGAYAKEFTCWADVADQTPQALLLRPKLGASAVRALIDTARESVAINRKTIAEGRVGAQAAVARLVGQLDDLDRAILAGQLWALEPVSQRSIAEQLGVHPVSVQRNLPRAQARLDELLADPAHQELVEIAAVARNRLGPYVPADVVGIELRGLGIQTLGQTAEVVLYAAGPYRRCGTWLETQAGSEGCGAQAAAAIAAAFVEQAAPPTAALLQALVDLGMPAGIALLYLETQSSLRRFGDVWVRWSGDTTANMAEAALHVLGAPATAEDVLGVLGSHSGTSLERVNAVLSSQDRFVRASRSTWGLRSWGIPEYAGIAHAIGECIDAAGGTARITDVLAILMARYPDITESSIRTYFSTLEFLTRSGDVRRRTKADGWPPVPPATAIRGVFLNGDNEIRVAIPVTSELLRGSGQAIHPAVATALGVEPSTRRTFTCPHGSVTVSWKLSSTTGANMGSLRSHAVAVGASTGDMLVMALRPAEASLDVTLLRLSDVGPVRLQKLLGRPVRRAAAALASVLDCPRGDVAAILRTRGDHQLASMLDR